MATSAIIEDSNWRFTVLAGQPAGVSSRREGQLEVMIDRRLKGDDGKGLSYGEASEVL